MALSSGAEKHLFLKAISWFTMFGVHFIPEIVTFNSF